MSLRFALFTAIFSLFITQAARAEGPVLFVDDPAILATLDARGFGFAGIFGVDGKGDLKTVHEKAPARTAASPPSNRVRNRPQVNCGAYF